MFNGMLGGILGKLFCSLGMSLGGCARVLPEINPSEINPFSLIDLNLASSILLDKLEEMKDDRAELYLPDAFMKIYKKDDVLKCYELKEVSAIHYIPEKMDCDDFAAELYGKFAGLAWTNIHALNWFYDEEPSFWWIEPQTGKISRTLEPWEGVEVRFFIAR